MLSPDLAGLYGVTVGAVTQALKRNANRFPRDFVFQLSVEEFADLKSQFVISRWGGSRTRPYAFTEQGVAMLSSVLKSERAIQVNIQIMRTFTKIREMLAGNKELQDKIEKLESDKVDSVIVFSFGYMKEIREDLLKMGYDSNQLVSMLDILKGNY